MELKNKKILAVGLARSGEAVAHFCQKRGAVVTVADIATTPEIQARAQALKNMGIAVELGPHKRETFLAADLIVISPGVPHGMELLEAARKKGIPVIGEIELAARHITEPVVAITGTNGKTTVTTLVGLMLEASGKKTFVGGNIGNPLIGYAGSGEKADVVVAEISSFQTDTIETFAPRVAVLLNITEDHLDRYPDMASYAASKARLFAFQKKNDAAILNSADAWVRHVASGMIAQKYYFPRPAEGEPGALVQPKRIDFTVPGKVPWFLSLEKVRIPGAHNRENIAAAALAAFLAGGTQEGIQRAVNEFNGLSHRMELCGEKDGVRYYNDSKATNVDAVQRALEDFSSPVILIMGGRDKASNFTLLGSIVSKKVKKLIVAGEAGEKIRSALLAVTDVASAASVPDAVKLASKLALPGDVVLLSPGCASFDAYKNYAERGEDFKRAVKGL